ncbi:hypothetical protein DL93DRAFT_2079195 [Clavulina sp. PMI_390]|nr:hypothetical protein DL93DRAFT_2079195 [Clavulina sp. PMI_390]
MDTTLETVHKHSPFGAMLSRTLPSYRGPYDVGVCDVEVAVPPETFGNFTHKSIDPTEHGAAGLALETVLYSIYYPTVQCSTKERVIWFPNPWQTIDGFLRMARRTPNFIYRAIAYPLIAAAIYGTTFPAKPSTPFLPPPSGTKWPLVIFSHGVGCSRLMYSTFCGEMASRGYVVCALEHRDGTSPCSMIVSEDGKAKVLNWLQWSDITYVHSFHHSWAQLCLSLHLLLTSAGQTYQQINSLSMILFFVMNNSK